MCGESFHIQPIFLKANRREHHLYLKLQKLTIVCVCLNSRHCDTLTNFQDNVINLIEFLVQNVCYNGNIIQYANILWRRFNDV